MADIVENAAPPVTLAEAKQHLKREDDDADDALIQIYLDAAIGHIDGRDGWLNRAIRVQRLTHRLPGFTGGIIRLPYPPLITVEAVEQRIGAEWTALDPTTWEVDDGVLVPMVGHSWPLSSGAVRVTYVAGYEKAPPALRAAILLMTEDLYRNRGTTASGTKIEVPMSTTVEMLLGPFRVFA